MPMINILIFLAGLLIYAGYGLPGLGYLAAATLLSYGAALLTGRFRWTMWVAVAAHGAMLVLLKLQPITGMELITAMGVSYFSLQLIAYNVDVWKGKYPAEKNLYRFALYVTYLPHLFIGPIEGYPQFTAALGQRRMNWDDLFHGGARALWGLFKKMVPKKLKDIVYVLIVACAVTLCEIILNAFLPSVYKSVGAYLPLLCVCGLVFSHSKKFEKTSNPITCLTEGLTCGFGYFATIVALSIVREFFGRGSFAGFKVFPEEYAMSLLAGPVGGFFLLGILVAVFSKFFKGKKSEEGRK